jgi:hypothetical protein
VAIKPEKTKNTGEEKRKNPKTEKESQGGTKKRKKKEQTFVPLVSSQRNRGDERQGTRNTERKKKTE